MTAALLFWVFNMKKADKIRRGLRRVGREVFLADGDWVSVPYYAVLEQRWKSNKSNFESRQTEIGYVSADYYTYIGPSDHDIEAVSENGYLYADGVKYIFKKKERVKMENELIYFSGVVRRVRETEYD